MKRRQPIKVPKEVAERLADTCSVLLRKIPVNLRDSFKAYCARRGISMQQRLLELMREDVKDDLNTMRKLIERERK